ncbi:MAG: formate dehydrogenase accessory protein FdhE [Myxococcales bacterium]
MSSPAAESVSEQFERRAERAEMLAPGAPSAEAPLLFAKGLFRAQAEMARALRSVSPKLEEMLEPLLRAAVPVLRHAESGPEALAEAARSRLDDDPGTARSRLRIYWDGGLEARDDYLSRAILQPWVRILAAEKRAPERPTRKGACPFCSGLPWMATRRGEADLQGGQRNLCCALCGGEWEFMRIKCPNCGEEDPHKLPNFHDEARKAVRIETCETCKRYVKSIDLSVDARPIADVDDLVTLALDLWADEQGYTRIEPGLAGI